VEQVMDEETGLDLTSENVEKVLEEIRPYLVGTGGGELGLLDIDGPIVKVKLSGPAAQVMVCHPLPMLLPRTTLRRSMPSHAPSSLKHGAGDHNTHIHLTLPVSHLENPPHYPSAHFLIQEPTTPGAHTHTFAGGVPPWGWESVHSSSGQRLCLCTEPLLRGVWNGACRRRYVWR
jgi:hypothetical protein